MRLGLRQRRNGGRRDANHGERSSSQKWNSTTKQSVEHDLHLESPGLPAKLASFRAAPSSSSESGLLRLQT
jgi:hypothetical protein